MLSRELESQIQHFLSLKRDTNSYTNAIIPICLINYLFNRTRYLLCIEMKIYMNHVSVNNTKAGLPIMTMQVYRNL